MPRCPFKGEVVWNPILGQKMHKVAEYRDRADGVTYGIYSDMMHVILKLMRQRVRDRYQNVVGIDGEAGSGKSSLALELIWGLEPGWDLEPNYCYTTVHILDKFSHWSSRSPITLIDEGTKAINSLNSRKADDNTFVQLLDTLRSFGGSTVICSPNFWAINKRVRNDHVNLLLAIPDKPLIKGFDRRGFYQVYVPQRGLFAEEVFWKQVGAGIYADLTEEQKRIYEPVKLRNQRESLEEIRKKLEGGK